MTHREVFVTAVYCRKSESDAITALCNQSDIVKEFIYGSPTISSHSGSKFYFLESSASWVGIIFVSEDCEGLRGEVCVVALPWAPAQWPP